MAKRVADVPKAAATGHLELVLELGPVVLGLDRLHHRIEAVGADLEPAQRFLQRLLERAADGHDLADGLHLRRQAVGGLRKFLEGEPRHLRHDVVDGRLERGRRRAARDLVLELVERVADRELGRHLRDREARRLRGERRGTRHARVHLDDEQPPVRRRDRELDVRPARVDADLAQHGDRRVAHALIFLVGQRLRRRHGDRIARVNAHRVEVLDRADDDAVVVLVANDLHLELFPADHRLLEQHLARRRLVEAAAHDVLELVAVVGDAAAAAAERERRPHDRREADLLLDLPRFLEVVRDTGSRRWRGRCLSWRAGRARDPRPCRSLLAKRR